MDNSELINNQHNSPEHKTPVLVTFQILGIVLRIVGFLFIGFFLASLTASLIYGTSIQQLESNLLNNKNLLLTFQGLNQFYTFLLLPILYILFIQKSLIPEVFQSKSSQLPQQILLATLIILFCIPLINWMISWNEAIKLPQFMESVEKWMQEKELAAKKATETIAYYNGKKEFIIGLIIISLLPALGEELLFRGVVQNEIKHYTGNPHWGIWLSAFLFSFLHFQFYGFFPRMMLGVTFGYLYYWSGSLLIPIFVHFVNNGLTYLLLNLYKQKAIELNPESTDSIPWYSVLISLILFTFLLITFKKISSKAKE